MIVAFVVFPMGSDGFGLLPLWANIQSSTQWASVSYPECLGFWEGVWVLRRVFGEF